MNYSAHYENLIASRRHLIRSKKDECFEQHHIIPRCLNGTNVASNLILLTPKEHYIAHLLLAHMYSGRKKAKMCYALMQMNRNNQNQNRTYSSRRYQLAKELMAKHCTGPNASFYGKKLTDDVKEKLRIRMSGDNNPSRKYGPWNKGIKGAYSASSSTRKKISKAHLGRKLSIETKTKIGLSHKGKPKSIEHKHKLSLANKGKVLSKITRNRMSVARKGVVQRTMQCSHCGLIGSISGIKRWHMENCPSLNV